MDEADHYSDEIAIINRGRIVKFVNPLTYAVDAVRGLLISGDLSSLAVDVAAILVFDVVIFAVASVSFRKIME
ncbi:MAG: hypothetical protein NUK54_06945 [Methanothrix sp.]|jgi:ABC-2 type transport system permease protein|nr:hypothetical protein [Methanothrix sp.]